MTGDVLVAVAVVASTAADVRLPPPCPGIRYVLCCQGTPETTPERPLPVVGRDDAQLIEIPGRGLSRSRNAALDFALNIAPDAAPDFLLFSDDDIDLDPDGITALSARMAADPGLALAAGWRAGRLPDRGPRAGVHDLTLANSGRVCAPEFMVRTADVRLLGVRFDPDFGVGATHPIGEDFIFVSDILKAGGRARAFPIVTGAHAGQSSGEGQETRRLLAARAAVFSRVFGSPRAALARLAFALRHRARFTDRLSWVAFVAGRL